MSASDQLRNSKVVVLLLGMLFLIALVFVTVYFLFPKEKHTPATGTATISVPSVPNNAGRRVFVKDFHTLESSISHETQRYIETLLYSSVSQSNLDLYTGSIRQGSYSNTLSGDLKVVNLMVDVEPANVTYLVSVRESQGARAVNVTCAPKPQQISQSTTCVELGWM